MWKFMDCICHSFRFCSIVAICDCLCVSESLRRFLPWKMVRYSFFLISPWLHRVAPPIVFTSTLFTPRSRIFCWPYNPLSSTYKLPSVDDWQAKNSCKLNSHLRLNVFFCWWRNCWYSSWSWYWNVQVTLRKSFGNWIFSRNGWYK